jgi:hypothetical protein
MDCDFVSLNILCIRVKLNIYNQIVYLMIMNRNSVTFRKECWNDLKLTVKIN